MMTTIPQISVGTSQDSQSTLQNLADSIRLKDTTTISLAPEPEPTITRDSDSVDLEDLDASTKGPGPLVKRLKSATTTIYDSQTSLTQSSTIEQALRPFTAATSSRHPGGVVSDLNQDAVLDSAIHARGMSAGTSIDLTFEISTNPESDGSSTTATINGYTAEKIGSYWVASIDGIDVALNIDEEAVIAAGGSTSLGTLSKPKGGRGPDALGAPGQLKKLPQHEDGVQPDPTLPDTTDTTSPKLAADPVLRLDLNA